MSLELSGQDWDFCVSPLDEPPVFPEDAGPDQPFDISVTEQDFMFKLQTTLPGEFPSWAGEDQLFDISVTEQGFIFKFQTSLPGEFPPSAGFDQDIWDHLVQMGQDWAFHIDAETVKWIRMWERFVEDEYRQKVKQPLRDGGLTAPSRGEIKLKVRKRG